MADFVAVATGNWNAWQTWFASDPGGGEGSQYPGNGDNLDLAGYTVTGNIARIPASGTLGNVTSTVSGAGVTGVAGKITMSVATQCYEFYCANVNLNNVGGAQIEYTGTRAGGAKFGASGGVYGGDVASNKGVYRNTSSTPFEITDGDFYGGTASAYGFHNNCSGGALTISASCSFTGGSANLSAGFQHGVNANITVPCPCTGGTHSGANGVYSTNTSAVITFQDTTLTSVTGAAINCACTPIVHGCNLIFGAVPCFVGQTPTMQLDATNYFRFGSEGSYVYVAAVPAASDLKDGVWCGNVEGTLTGGGYGIL